MKIQKEVTVKLSPKEIEEILIKYLKDTKGFNISNVIFDVNGHEDPDDWRASLPLSYRLDNVICKGFLADEAEE